MTELGSLRRRMVSVSAAALMVAFVSAVGAAETGASAVSGEPGRVISSPALSAAAEKHLSPDEPRTEWTRGDDKEQQGDRLEVKQVLGQELKTVKLQNVV